MEIPAASNSVGASVQRRVRQFDKSLELLGVRGRKVLSLFGAGNTAAIIAKTIPCAKSTVSYWKTKLVNIGALRLQTHDVVKIYSLTPFGSKLLRIWRSHPTAFYFHAIFAHFQVSQAVYEAALEHWPLKHKITNQILPRMVFKHRGCNVDVRIYPKGKACFIIGATANPFHFNQINDVYNRIVQELKKIAPELKPATLQFRVSRCDAHYDCFSLPTLHSVLPKPNTTISIHNLRKRKLYRIEVRGSFNDAIKTLAKLLGLRSFSI